MNRWTRIGRLQMNRWIIGAVLASALTWGGGLALGGTEHEDGKGHHGGASVLPDCPVMDEPIDLGISVAADDGPVFFCCKGCIPKYEANPAKYAARIAKQRKALADRAKVQVTCPITGESVDPKVYVEHDGQKVSFCCKGCVKKFQKDPNKYKVALANSYTHQTKCPVMGEDVDPKVFVTGANGQKIYFCCKGCDKKFAKDPAKYAPSMVAQGFTVNPAALKLGASDGHGHGHGHGAHDHGDHD